MRVDNPSKRLLLISNSTLYGHAYLDHVEEEIRDFLGGVARVLFVPFALYDRQAYSAKVRERLAAMGYGIDPIPDEPGARRAVEEAQAVFIGGGNTFRLLKGLYEHGLLSSIGQRVEAGVPYIGSSAGSIVACPTIKTTKDIPIVEPSSFRALGLVTFQISPHYLDPDPTSTHMGETQEERICQFLEENDAPVVGLREGAWLRVEGGSVVLKGSAGARLFRRGHDPVERVPGMKLDPFLSLGD